MLGGYQIIDLRKIGLELKGTQQTISDAGILKQLRGLRDYIEKSHDYTKPLNNSLKPILIRYRDQKNNEKREVTSFASINNTNNSLTFTVESKHLQIEVVFEEKTDDDGNKYYDIKTAKYLYSLNEDIEGDLELSGDLSVGGDADVTGDASVGGNLSVTGSINGEANPSVKPIYCHPIRVYDNTNTADTSFMFSIMVFNNDATPINSKAKLIQWMKDLYQLVGNIVTINASGFYKTITSLAYIYIYSIEGQLTFGCDGRGSTNAWTSITELENAFLSDNCTVTDGVNKIN